MDTELISHKFKGLQIPNIRPNAKLFFHKIPLTLYQWGVNSCSLCCVDLYKSKGIFRMNPFDILIVTILLFCLVRGLFRGFVLEVSSIIGVLAGAYGASIYYPVLSRILSQWISNAAYRNIFSHILIFVTIFFIIGLIGKMIRMLLKIAFMGWFDRLFGAGFGAAKGCLIASVLLLIFTVFLPGNNSILKTSRLSPYLSVVSGNISKIAPRDMQRSFTTNLDGVKKMWENQR